MNLKRLSSAALALAMAATLAPAALAAPAPDFGGFADSSSVQGDIMPLSAPLLIAPAPEEVAVPLGESYRAQLFLNGEALDASAIPAVEPGLLPMRLICEADGGSAEWYEADNQGFFYLGNTSVIVNFADCSIDVNLERAEGVTATLVDGVTFLPAEFIGSLEGIEVNLNPEMDVDRIDVSTPNGTPFMKMANAIIAAANMRKGMQTSPAELEEFYGEAMGFKAEYMTEGMAFLPMMTNPDTLILGKAADGKLEALKESFEAYRKSQEDTFSWYLSHNLPKVQNAKFVTEGEWFMFLIGENADAAVETFHAKAAEMK